MSMPVRQIAALVMLFCCSSRIADARAEHDGRETRLLPTPRSVHERNGSFRWNDRTVIMTVPGTEQALAALTRMFGRSLPVIPWRSGTRRRNAVEFRSASPADSIGTEGYRLQIDPRGIEIVASAPAGFFYAVQTLGQLIPDQNTPLSGPISIPAVDIVDWPRFPYRGFLLDSGRQFHSLPFLERYLDLLARYKINMFHWHLTDGQGWRVEIPQYPRLTSVGSSVAAGPEQQGYYSRDDIRRIVRYAQERCITIVPEIDLPGHSEAALIAYPEFSCRKKAPKSVMEFSSDLFCAGNESTYVFLGTVLSEVCALFPGPMVHLGGDEAPKEAWDSCADCRAAVRASGCGDSHGLQIMFSRRLADTIIAKGKTPVFWGDVIERGGPTLPSPSIIQWWNVRKRGDTAFTEAVRRGHRIINATNYYTYLNYPVTPWSQYGADRTFDLRDAYLRDPSDTMVCSRTLGITASLWTDWNVTMTMVDRRVFPRLFALVEQMWSVRRPAFPEFYRALNEYHYPRLRRMNVGIGPALREETPMEYRWD